MRFIALAAASLVAAGCQQQGAEPTPAAADSTAGADAIRKLEDSQMAAVAAKDGNAAAAVYAPDAVFISENGSLSNGADIGKMFTEMVKDPNLKVDYQPGNKTFSDDGTMAYATAPYTVTYTDSASNKPVTTKGTNLSVWKKQADGNWKLVADSNAGVIAG